MENRTNQHPSIQRINHLVDKLIETKRIERCVAKIDGDTKKWLLKINDKRYIKIRAYADDNSLHVGVLSVNIGVEGHVSDHHTDLYNGPMGSESFIQELFDKSVEVSVE